MILEILALDGIQDLFKYLQLMELKLKKYLQLIEMKLKKYL